MKRLILAALAALFACPATAQGTKCLPRSLLVADLEAKYGERLTGGGLQNPQQLLEVWTSPISGSFTVFITRADGMACVMATGKHWQGQALLDDAEVPS